MGPQHSSVKGECTRCTDPTQHNRVPRSDCSSNSPSSANPPNGSSIASSSSSKAKGKIQKQNKRLRLFTSKRQSVRCTGPCSASLPRICPNHTTPRSPRAQKRRQRQALRKTMARCGRRSILSPCQSRHLGSTSQRAQALIRPRSRQQNRSSSARDLRSMGMTFPSLTTLRRASPIRSILPSG